MGMILGTAAYMAPEQARGQRVDKRADIWAFGCVLYEMLTGRRPFAGDDITEILASVVKDPPDLSAAPPELQRLLGDACRRIRKRIRDIADVWDLVDEPGAMAQVVPPARRKSPLPWIVATAGVLTAVALAVHDFSESAVTPPGIVRFQVPWPADASVAADSGARARFSCRRTGGTS